MIKTKYMFFTEAKAKAKDTTSEAKAKDLAPKAKVAKAKAKDTTSEAKAKDLATSAKAKAKDMTSCPRGTSRPRPWPRGLYLWRHSAGSQGVTSMHTVV